MSRSTFPYYNPPPSPQLAKTYLSSSGRSGTSRRAPYVLPSSSSLPKSGAGVSMKRPTADQHLISATSNNNPTSNGGSSNYPLRSRLSPPNKKKGTVSLSCGVTLASLGDVVHVGNVMVRRVCCDVQICNVWEGCHFNQCEATK